MNKNVTALILIVLAIGIYFTFTAGKIAEIQSVRVVNAQYQSAINDSNRLITIRDKILQDYNNISQDDKDRLDKIVPDNVDNVRLIIDVKDDIAAKDGLVLKNIKTSSPAPVETASPDGTMTNTTGSVTLSFDVTTTYESFVAFLKDLESSLRIMDITKLTLTTNDKGTYDFSVELKTYWLRQ